MDNDQQPGEVFRTTRWTMVLDAACTDTNHAKESLERLCRIYWRPVYHFIRLRGHTMHDAEDFTQEFFEALISKKYLQSVSKDKGKFRSFLMASIKHFLSDQYDKRRALKRGGGMKRIAIDVSEAEDFLEPELNNNTHPEEAFDRAWAKTLFQRTLVKQDAYYQALGKGDRYHALKPYLLRAGKTPYADMAQQLDISVDQVKTEVKRIRQNFQKLFEAEVRETTSSHSDCKEEITYLAEKML